MLVGCGAEKKGCILVVRGIGVLCAFRFLRVRVWSYVCVAVAVDVNMGVGGVGFCFRWKNCLISMFVFVPCECVVRLIWCMSFEWFCCMCCCGGCDGVALVAGGVVVCLPPARGLVRRMIK